ncbi:MAG: helix-turn-helix transcriptional regulator [Bacilli bacterium]|nr:helix-turn-helix transcriptional regulator [Bacilli bacterium]
MDQKKIGKFICSLRKEKQFTQEQLAEKLGVSINAVSKWERGLSFPDVSLYKDLCKELDINIEELINGEKSKSSTAKEKAIINVVKTNKTEKQKKNIIIIVFTLLITLLIIFGLIIYKYKSREVEDFYERNYQLTFVARDVEAFFKYRFGDVYPDFYGGMYISDDSYNLIVQIVEEKIPVEGTMEYYYYNELSTVDERIKTEYVKYSYNELLNINNTITDYFSNNKVFEDLNSWYIDVYNNRVVVNFVEVTDSIKKEFKDKVIDSEIVVFESAIDNINDDDICKNYPKEIGTDILEYHGEVLISIHVGNKDYVPVSLSLYDDGTYELFTAYESCRPGRICTSMLKYTKSVKGTYKYDVEKIIKASVNADNKSYDMSNLPEYEIYLGDKYIKKYDSLMFTVEKGKKNKYLNELLDMIDVDLDKCAKPEYE